MSAPKRSLTPQEVADLEQVCAQTIYRRIAAGELKAHKYGRHYRITPEDLQDFRDRQAVVA